MGKTVKVNFAITAPSEVTAESLTEFARQCTEIKIEAAKDRAAVVLVRRFLEFKGLELEFAQWVADPREYNGRAA